MYARPSVSSQMNAGRTASKLRSGDEARSAAQAARLEIGARSLAESFSHHATLLRRHVLDGSLGLSPAGLPCLLANRNSLNSELRHLLEGYDGLMIFSCVESAACGAPHVLDVNQ